MLIYRIVLKKSWINMDTKSKRCFMQDFHCCSFDEKIPSEFATHDPLCFNVSDSVIFMVLF